MNERVLELATALRKERVGAAFGVPGSGLSWQLATALGELGAGFVGVRHEGAGAIMAGAYGRVSGSLGCSLSIKGPGLANALPGIASNHYEGWATIHVAEAFGPATPPTRMHKRLDHRLLLAPVVKGYSTLGNARETVPGLARLARAEVPGPVHLDLFAEVGPAAMDVMRSAAEPAPAGRDALAPLQRAIEQSRRPVVIAGSLASRHAWGTGIEDLCVPVFTTASAKGLIDERSPYAAGVYTGDGKELAPESRLLAEADLVVGIGLRNLEVLSPKPFAAPLVMADAAGPEVANGFAPAQVLTGASGEQLEQVVEMLAGREWGVDLVAASQRAVRDELTAHDWLPGRVFVELARLVPSAERLTVDTGSFCTVAEHVWQAAPRRREFLASGNGRYMGTAIPMALGAACASARRPQICAIGDGGMMYAAELKMAVERALPILFVLMTDGRYGSIACAPSAKGLDYGAVTMRQPSWYRAVQALGMPAAQVRSVPELEDAVAAWGAEAAGPMFVEAVFDPEPYAAMTARVR